jgi:hypothetical protein
LWRVGLFNPTLPFWMKWLRPASLAWTLLFLLNVYTFTFFKSTFNCLFFVFFCKRKKLYRVKIKDVSISFAVFFPRKKDSLFPHFLQSFCLSFILNKQSQQYCSLLVCLFGLFSLVSMLRYLVCISLFSSFLFLKSTTTEINWFFTCLVENALFHG